ncbi:MAG TPA: AsmA-like C-terminal region-containing protein [Candidatus Acidoferrum sp.]|nr:AsmA-like C-terminal region-containing protein [Candidatus Acidoferrum sp.]
MSQSHAAILEHHLEGRPAHRPARKRWLIVTAAALLAFAIVGLILLALHWPFTRQRVIDGLQEDFHGTVTFRDFHLTFLPHPGCVAEGAALVRPGFPSSPPFVSAQKLIIRAHYLDFLLRPGFISRIELQGLQIHVPPIGTMPPEPPDPNPSTNTVGQVIANTSILEVARKAAPPLHFDIHALTLHSVSHKAGFSYDVAFLNAQPPGEIQSRGHFGPWNASDPGQTPVFGTYKFEHAYLGNLEGIDGVLAAHDSFQGTLNQIETHGSVEIPDFQVRRAARSSSIDSRFHAFVDALHGDVHLEHVETTIVNTIVLARGAVEESSGHPGKVTSLDLNVSRGRIQDLLRLFIKEPRSPIVGAISFRAHVTVPPLGRPFEQEVILVGDFGIDDGRFTKAETNKKVAGLSQRAQGKKTDDKDKGTVDPEEEDAERIVSDLKGHVDLKNGIATLTDISFSIPGAVANVHGTFNLLNEKIDFHGTLKTDAEFSKMGGGGLKSIFLKPFDAMFKKKPKGAEIPIKMTGTYSHPQPGLEISGGKKDDTQKDSGQKK